MIFEMFTNVLTKLRRVLCKSTNPPCPSKPSKKAHNENQRFSNVLCNRSGQMEMIGLVIIVILITLGLLFITIFAVSGDGGRKIFTQKGIASSTMSALMKTTVEDCDEPLLSLEKDLLDECAQNYEFIQSSSGYSCEGKNSCDYLNDKINELLEDTLASRGYKYQFESELIELGSKETKTIVGPITNKGGCPFGRGNREPSGPFYLSAGGRQVRSQLFICG